MKRRGLIAAVLAGAASVALHAGVVVGVAPEAPQGLPGGAPQLAMVGNSFEDAVAGTVSGTTDPVPTQPVETPPAAADRAAPSRAAAATVPALAPSSSPTSVARPAPLERAPTTEVGGAQAVPAMTADLPGAAPLAPSPPVTPSAVRPATTAAPSRPVAAAQATTAVALDATVTAQDGPVARVPEQDTPRPRPRTAHPEPSPAPDPKAPEPPPQPTPQGNAAERARAGDARGAAEGNATRTQAGTTGQAENDGRAAAEYPQRVNQHLIRLRRPSTRFGGAAVVSFTIAGNGGLAALSIARSSGNAEFDRLALAHVQRAAPFPPPPAGAQRRFNVTVQGH